MTPSPTVLHLPMPEGRVAYEVTGPHDGALVVLVPGMGDLRSSWRDVTAPLVAAGHRVAVTDVRGHGDSDATFTHHGVAATADDVSALLDALGADAARPAVLVGASFAAGAVARVAAREPARVRGLVLVAYASNDVAASRAVRTQVSVLLRRPWGPAAWAWFYRSLLHGRRAAWTGEHLRDLRAALRRPAYLEQLRALAVGLVAGGHETLLEQVTSPVLVVTGAQDPETSDAAAAHAAVLASARSAQVTGLLVPEAGHYPQHQRADVVAPAVLAHVAAVTTAAAAPEDA
ncbi:alpha/beta fold hydrolase [Cellulomonas shaoxiangyii]|uniref:Alpha/beta fold hydrolase n=1 Tax=Cellulomonas shaoxiangyii TaxID=2566013 RepID=A0A4V1CMW8_9CELL|nr:alpha/beta fold hydrolase [Cellulomonas shaoxiangyii]QCB94395.1 alpha/beta fold hydrolase [Cellulomonas shaoxiangyii]TGY84765.1 alpha/beta fold hydrolase [Cellulomonas shaoxiangyii]